jgi:hypothetical protein
MARRIASPRLVERNRRLSKTGVVGSSLAGPVAVLCGKRRYQGFRDGRSLRATSSPSCPSLPATQTASRMRSRPSRNRALVTRFAPNARAAKHCLPTVRSPMRVTRQPRLNPRNTSATSFRELSLISSESSRRALPPLKARCRIALQGSLGTEGKCDGVAVSPAKWSSETSSHQGTVSSSHGSLDVLAAKFPSDAFCDLSSRRPRLVKCLSGVFPSLSLGTSGSAMTSIDAAGHTLSTAETGTTRERRPPTRRKAAPWGVANRLTRPRCRPFVPMASKPSQCSSQ